MELHFRHNTLHQGCSAVSSDVVAWAKKLHEFARSRPGQRAATYYVLIFCTRVVADEEFVGLPEGTIMVTRQGCKALLKPFHASALVSHALGEQGVRAVEGLCARAAVEASAAHGS